MASYAGQIEEALSRATPASKGSLIYVATQSVDGWHAYYAGIWRRKQTTHDAVMRDIPIAAFKVKARMPFQTSLLTRAGIG